MLFPFSFTLAASAIAVFFASVPLAAEPCRTTDQFIDALAPVYRKVADLRGDEAVRFVETFNKLPPPTIFVGDRVLIFYRSPIVTTMIFSGGCYLTHGTFTVQIFKSHFPTIDLHGREVNE
jgi:hypothetical protein